MAEYDPYNDPIALQKEEIEKLDMILSKLIDISNFEEEQHITQDSIERKLTALNGNIMFGIVAFIIIGVIFIFK